MPIQVKVVSWNFPTLMYLSKKSLLGTEVIVSPIPAAFSVAWAVSDSFSALGVSAGTVIARLSFWPPLVKMPSEPIVQPSPCSRDLALFGS